MTLAHAGTFYHLHLDEAMTLAAMVLLMALSLWRSFQRSKEWHLSEKNAPKYVQLHAFRGGAPVSYGEHEEKT
jgi:hypothetical protein